MVALADLRPGDLFENPPGVWWTQEITRLQGAQGFHWGMFVDPVDLIATESIGKGTAITRYNYARSFIYRIKDLPTPTVDQVINAVADYGRSTYNMGENITTAWNFILDSWLPQYPWDLPTGAVVAPRLARIRSAATDFHQAFQRPGQLCAVCGTSGRAIGRPHP